MKKNISRFLSLFLLCALCLSLCACSGDKSKSETADETVVNEDVSFSNIRFAGDKNIPAKAQTIIDELEGMLRGFEYSPSDELLKGRNSSGSLSLDIDLLYMSYDEKGNILKSSVTNFDGFEPGMEFAIPMFLNSGSTQAPASAEIAAEFAFEDCNYRTKYVPLKIEQGLPISLEYKGGLPCEISGNVLEGRCVYRLEEMEILRGSTEDHYSLCFRIRKLSGPTSSYEGLNGRIVDKDGVVCATPVMTFNFLSAGESCLATVSFLHLIPGSYELEFYEE